MSAASNHTSVLRKRALRRLAREQTAAYAAIYEKVRPGEPSGHHARGKTWTLLRHQFPDRYLELFAEEQAAPQIEIPPDIRTKSWQRAMSRLADLRADDWRQAYDALRTRGMPEARAWERAVAPVREANEGLFTRLLAEEYKLWLFAAEVAAGA